MHTGERGAWGGRFFDDSMKKLVCIQVRWEGDGVDFLVFVILSIAEKVFAQRLLF